MRLLSKDSVSKANPADIDPRIVANYESRGRYQPEGRAYKVIRRGGESGPSSLSFSLRFFWPGSSPFLKL